MFSRLLFLSLIASQLLAVSPVVVETGEIAGAKFTLARPAAWNKRLLLVAHGYRGEDRPLVADLFPEHLAYRALLDEGWIVAKTSFRRNGIIVADAIADLDALREHVAKKFGAPERVLLEGESMGGLIVTLLAERDFAPEDRGRPKYHGAVAIGAALVIAEGGRDVPLSLVPHVPLLFLTNQSELDGPRGYVTRNQADRVDPNLRPALFRVSRDGHVNVNQRERLVALRALNAWLDRGRATLPEPAANAEFFDATVPPAPAPSTVALHADARGFDPHVTEVSGNYGNLELDAQPADFAAIGVGMMQYFELTAHGQKFRVRLGRDFSSVARGEWVAFANADGFYWLARNFGDAAATAKLQLGDTLTIRRFDDAK
jgi:pimeloyl-ACP methyl ester carboxylesterase